MGLRIKPLGEYLYQIDARNTNGELEQDAVRGIATSKVFISTKANLNGVSLSNYKIVPPRSFAYVPDTSRRGNKISLAFNDSNDRYLVSSISVVFGVKTELESELIPEYLYLYFNRPEFDRYTRFNSWGSARETFSWEDLCSTEFVVPTIGIQKNCVNVFHGMQENLDALQKGIAQMQSTCSIYMENLVRTVQRVEIGKYIHAIENRNYDLTFGMDSVRGISNTKEIMPTKADVKDGVIGKFYVIKPREFIYNPRTTRMGDKVGLAYNNTEEPLLFTFNNLAFAMNDGAEQELLPDYLYMFFRRSEFDRFARINSWGSATELFAFDDLCRYKIPLPDIKVQQNIVNIFNALYKRKRLETRLAELQKRICPILIRGAIEERGC